MRGPGQIEGLVLTDLMVVRLTMLLTPTMAATTHSSLTWASMDIMGASMGRGSTAASGARNSSEHNGKARFGTTEAGLFIPSPDFPTARATFRN